MAAPKSHNAIACRVHDEFANRRRRNPKMDLRRSHQPERIQVPGVNGADLVATSLGFTGSYKEMSPVRCCGDAFHSIRVLECCDQERPGSLTKQVNQSCGSFTVTRVLVQCNLEACKGTIVIARRG